MVARFTLWVWLVLAAGLAACQMVAEDGRDIGASRFWNGFGPVLPHEDFPADCSLCHTGEGWHDLTEDFEFDHAAETGTALDGAHAEAACLLCHNDRGPVAAFQAQGCVGCHGDPHEGALGGSCTACHTEVSWLDALVGKGSLELDRRHRQAGFPLVGSHAFAACDRCHTGADQGLYQPTPRACEGCHGGDLAQAVNPNHVGLGWTTRCDRCHQPFTWQEAEL